MASISQNSPSYIQNLSIFVVKQFFPGTEVLVILLPTKSMSFSITNRWCGIFCAARGIAHWLVSIFSWFNEHLPAFSPYSSHHHIFFSILFNVVDCCVDLISLMCFPNTLCNQIFLIKKALEMTISHCTDNNNKSNIKRRTTVPHTPEWICN